VVDIVQGLRLLDGVAVRRVVETGFSNRGMVEILSGIEDEDSVITVGQIGLKADATVDVINREPEVSLAEGSAADPTEEGNDAAAD